MKKTSIYAGLLAGVVMTLQAPVYAQSILDDPIFNQLEDQDINANDDLIEALRRAALRGPIFRISPEEIAIDMEAGERRSVSVRITNSGDQSGELRGINLIGSTSGLEMSTTCNDELKEGDFCEISLSYRSTSSRDVNTAIIGTINEIGRSNFEIPVSISVQEPPAPIPEPVKPEPVVVVRPDPASLEPKPRDIARQYFGVIGPIGRNMSNPRGFTIVSADKDPRTSTEVAGVRYQDIRVETVRTDERYDRQIPYTDASLPVNRDKILTADRVIKAVLDTPVSNVMCNKVVAMVESDVYSATSQRPLIQAGSKVIGECQEFADERVGIAWSRIITTDGRSITFQDKLADTHDATGLGGVPGRIYMSPFDKYVLPIFSTMIDTTAGVIFAAFGDDEEVVTDEFGNTSSSTSATNEGLRIVTGEARTTAQQIISDIRDVREVAVIPKGSRIDIEIQEDIYFRDDRKVVTLADMRFDLDEIEVGGADRDLPKNLVLRPVEAGYQGATVVVGGRRYRLEDSEGSSEAIDTVAENIPEISSRTLDDISPQRKTQGE
jgi:type IV secretory pathway VirB10-like protein